MQPTTQVVGMLMERSWSPSGAKETKLIRRRRPFNLTEPPETFAPKGKSQIDFSTWLLFMPATTYSPTHFRVQYNRPSGA
jgi:hypothetical protein